LSSAALPEGNREKKEKVKKGKDPESIGFVYQRVKE